MERLEVKNSYSAHECAIHLARYNFAKQFCKNKRVLDISCGEGYGSYILSLSGSKEVVGIDISEETISIAKKNYKSDNLKYIVSDASVLKDFDDNYFDLIVSFETIEHLKDVNEYLKEIKRVAKKDAIIVISCPNDYYYYPTEEEYNEFHKKKYTFNDFKSVTESILGKYVQYFMGMETMGYININPKEMKDVNTNLAMLRTNDLLETIKLSSEHKLDFNICNYYIGIWNASVIKENATVFPYMYTDWKESSNILKKDVNELSNLVEDYKKNYQLLNDERQKLIEETQKLHEEKKALIQEINKLKQLNTILYNKNEEAIKHNMMNYEYLNAILNSRSYKLAQMIRKIMRRK